MGVKIFISVFFFIWQNVVATTNPMKSIKINEKVTYDCIDIHKQPSLQHSLLKNHKLQLKPSRTQSGPSVRSAVKEKTFCPIGTVPILRTANQDNDAAATYISRNLLNQVMANEPVKHMAAIVSESEPSQSNPTVYTGVGAAMSLHNLNIAKDQITLAQISLLTFANGQGNGVQAGWMINPSLFGDSRPWTFGYWLGSKGSGCYNTRCTGFVQVSSNPLSEPLDPHTSDRGIDYLNIAIHKDEKTGNWWIQNFYDKKVDDIGYWPKELFDQMGNGGQRAVLGGFVGPSPTGSSPPMGDGRFPDGKITGSASFLNMRLAGSDGKFVDANKFRLLKGLDAEKCYNLDYTGYIESSVGVTMLYGGPGGSSCSA